MSWYVVDAVDRAFDRTKKCLLEPFDFWKWVKLAIIVMLVGGGGSGFNGGGNSYSTDDAGIEGFSDFLDSIFSGFSWPDISSPDTGLIIALIVLLVLFILILSYVSNLMEFVLVESLVSNDVRFWEYSRRFLGKGWGLFLFRIVVGIILLIPIIVVSVPIIMALVSENATSISPESIIAFIVVLIPLILLIAIIGGIIQSFVNLSIPVSIYTEKGIFTSFRTVLGRFRKDWQQIVIYWLGRIVLAIAVGIIVAIVALVAMVLLFLIALILDGILYLILSAIITGKNLVLIILAPLIFVQLLIFILMMLMIAMPGRVFLKYHMLSFLDQWYPEIGIPMFDGSYQGDLYDHNQL